MRTHHQNNEEKKTQKNSPERLEEESDREDIDGNIVDDFVMPSLPRMAVIEDLEEDKWSTYPITQKDHRFIEPFPGNQVRASKCWKHDLNVGKKSKNVKVKTHGTLLRTKKNGT